MSELQMKQIKTPEQIKEMCFLASRIWREHYGQILSADQITYMVENIPAQRLGQLCFRRTEKNLPGEKPGLHLADR